MSDFKQGDRVRAVFEGTWDADELTFGGAGMVASPNCKLYETHTLKHALSVEKIESPVEVFEPGDIVREKDTDEDYYTVIGAHGYTQLDDGQWWEYDKNVPKGYFTSEHYEKVTLVEPPL